MENEKQAPEVLPIPMSDRILVHRDPKVTQVGKILLPGEAQSRPKKGMVIAVGPGRILEDGTIGAIEVQVGDHVWFSPFAGLNVSEEIEEEAGFVVMRQDDILLRDLRAGETLDAAVRAAEDQRAREREVHASNIRHVRALYAALPPDAPERLVIEEAWRKQAAQREGVECDHRWTRTVHGKTSCDKCGAPRDVEAVDA